jgi:hypothetical protein
MPIPKPKKGETRKDHMARCMGNPTMVREYPDEKQRAAVCGSAWEQKHALLAAVMRARGLRPCDCDKVWDQLDEGAD